MGIQSMTGFGAGSAREGTEEISVEIKSVNGKFCEVKPRLPRELAALEAELVKRVKDRLSRGNVDVTVKRSTAGGLAVVPHVNAALVRAYAKALREAARDADLPTDLSLRDLVGLDGVAQLQEPPPDLTAAAKALASAASTALDALIAARGREGAALEADLRGRAQALRRLTAQAADAVPASLDAYRERLRTRVRELAPDLEIDRTRLEQEVVLIAERTDVAEELTRLHAHFEEIDRLMARSGPIGRQLDFLIQEINREINTTGSKSQSSDITRLVVELKTEAERIREQVQNVE